jgi:hypothetical protein
VELGGAGVIGRAGEIDQIIGEGVGSIVAVERTQAIEDVGQPPVQPRAEGGGMAVTARIVAQIRENG